MQFSALTALCEADLGVFRSLHLSLNAPVIAIDELPVGPARAAVALCAPADGGLHLQIAVRSLRTGEVVAVASALPAENAPDERAAVDAALSFAEGMGFLFDEDEIADGDEAAGEKAAALWHDLVDGLPERTHGPEVGARSEPVDTFAATEAATFEIPIAVPLRRAEEIEVEQAEVVPALPEALLSKFRLVLRGAGPGRGAIDVEAAETAASLAPSGAEALQ
jgi:hypothetical protein